VASIHHPTAPASRQASVATLVARCGRCVYEAVRGVELLSPAFALCLFPSDDANELAPVNIALGLETDRERGRSGATPFDAFDDVWNPTRYTYIALNEFDDPPGEPDFDAASSALVSWLSGERVGDPATWLLEELAAKLTRTPPVAPVTDDFVCWVFAQGDRLMESLNWILPEATRAKLAGKQLLVDDPDQLEGVERWAQEGFNR
jgi:hypothetical protein